MSACKSCGAPVLWCTTASGKSMPVDAEPSDRGNVEVQGLGCTVHPQPVPGGRLSHFVSCKDAKKWRQK